MGQQLLPSRMSLPEVMGDPCAGTLREHAFGILRAAAQADKLTRSHPGVADDIGALRDNVERLAAAVLGRLAGRGGDPGRGRLDLPDWRADGGLSDRPLKRLLDLDAQRHRPRISDHRAQRERPREHPSEDLLDARSRSAR